MKKLNQKGFTAFEIILLIVVLLLIAGAGYYVWKLRSANKPAGDTSPSKPHTSEKKEEPRAYDVSGLGVKLKYPKDWGEATLADGPIMSPGTGSYKQLTFSSQKNININFVVGAYNSPLDGCGLGTPEENEKHALNAVEASVIGWDATNVKRYMSGQGTPAKVYMYSIKPGEIGDGWVSVSTSDKVLEYKDIDSESNRWKADSAGLACGTVTQAQADAANAYKKYVHYAVNVSNDKFKGANAQYDARTNDDSALRAKIVTVLNSIQ